MKEHNWKKCKIDEIKAPIPNSLVTGPFGSSISSCFFQDFGTPVIRGSNLSEDIGKRLIDEGLVFLSDEKAMEFSRSAARRGDLIFTCWGTIGQIGLIDDRSRYSEYIISNKQMKLTPDLKKADPLFLYYLLSSPEVTNYIQNIGIGSSVPGFNLGQLKNLEITVPPLPTQYAIAHILGSLDDKIDLNRQMNETLEAMAQAIFQSWFVDFDPVRAKAEGCETGLPPEIAALFPSELVEADGREVPRGWHVSKIGDELTTLLGGTPSRDVAEYWLNGNIPWINSGKANEFRVLEPTEYITQLGMANSATKMLPERTTMIAITGATLGQVSLLEISSCANQSIIGILGTNKIPNEFVYFWIKTNIQELISCQTGGAQQHINKNNVNDLEILLPGPLVLEAYLRQTKSIFDLIKSNCVESLTLAQIRDALLPKLMSGEINIFDRNIMSNEES